MYPSFAVRDLDPEPSRHEESVTKISERSARRVGVPSGVRRCLVVVQAVKTRVDSRGHELSKDKLFLLPSQRVA